jgi:hypothetical protein
MANFAVLDGQNVINTIVAESKAIAEEVTGKTCVQYTNESAEVGGTYVDEVFLQRKPFPSAVLNSDNQWEHPIPVPAFDEENPKNYAWDESVVNWVEVKE